MEQKNNSMIKYNKESIWNKIRRKLLNIFSRKEKVQKEVIVPNFNNNNISKQEFFDLYTKVKNGDVELTTLDKDTLYKIMVVINEELILNTKIMDDTLDSIKISLDNVKQYRKQIELLEKG